MHVNKKELSSIFGVSERTLTQWQKQGLPVEKQGGRGQSNTYETVDVIKWYNARETSPKPSKEPPGKTTGDSDDLPLQVTQDEMTYVDYQIKQANLKQIHLKNDEQERKNLLAEGVLAPTELMTDALAKLAFQVSQVLDSIPSKLKLGVPHLKPSELNIAKNLVVQAQNQVADLSLDLDFIDALEDDDPPEEGL